MKTSAPFRAISAAVALAVLIPAAACTAEPATRDEVCASFDDLGRQLLEGNGILGNPLFRKTEALADVAERFDGQPSLADDAAALQEIADSDSTSGEDLMNATTRIADLCGHPLGMNAILGN